MHYYQHHIGDFNNATRHLTRIERSIYRDLIELYYDTEKPLILDIPKLSRLVCANNPEETQSVISVLSEFFEDTPKGYVNKRCNLEINNYAHRVEVNRANGKHGGRPIGTGKKTQSVNFANPNESENNPNHKPLTINQEPLKSKQYTPPIGAQLLSDWLEVRKAKRAGKLTETAFKGLVREAAAAGISPEQAVTVCIERGWQSFKAEWLVKAPAQGRGYSGAQEVRPILTTFAPKKEISPEQVARNKQHAKEMADSFLRKVVVAR